MTKEKQEPEVTMNPFGTLKSGDSAVLIRLTDRSGYSFQVTNYGAALQSLTAADREGHPVDVILGYDTLPEYEAGSACFGATMGRCANRIADASFSLSGRRYAVSPNRGNYHIHGGYEGFHKKLWRYDLRHDSVRFMLCSPDGDEGYPGNLTAEVLYRWVRPGTLLIQYDAVSDQETVINFTNHSYFNLNGHDSGTVLEHRLSIHADTVSVAGEYGIPTGRFASVADTPLDFRTDAVIGSKMEENHPLFFRGRGYDDHYILPDTPCAAARLTGMGSGITMTVCTDLPDLGLYTAGALAAQAGKGGARYGPFSGVCLEPQFLPNAVNLYGHIPKPVFAGGRHYRYFIEYQFSLLESDPPHASQTPDHARQ